MPALQTWPRKNCQACLSFGKALIHTYIYIYYRYIYIHIYIYTHIYIYIVVCVMYVPVELMCASIWGVMASLYVTQDSVFIDALYGSV